MNSAGSSPVDAPPAYSWVQEFDRKLAITIDESQRSTSNGSGKKGEDEEDTENPDGRGEAHARSGSAGHAPVVQPLKFKKKHNRQQSDMPTAKERPRWLGEFQQTGSSTSDSRRRSLPRHLGQGQRNDSPVRHFLPEDATEDRFMPPPPFVSVDNSLDGPAYECYASDSRRRRAGHGQMVLRFESEDMSASPPPSPLERTRPRAVSPPPSRNSSQFYHQPQTGQANLRAPNINRSASPAAHKQQQLFTSAPPRMSFDPAVAYDSSQTMYAQYGDEPVSVAGGAAALYSSAVAPHLLHGKTSSLGVPKGNRLTSSNLPAYDHRRSPSPYGTPDFAASRVSVYSQASVVSTAPSSLHHPMLSQHPQIVQYPAQPGYPRQQHYPR